MYKNKISSVILFSNEIYKIKLLFCEKKIPADQSIITENRFLTSNSYKVC